MNEFTLHVMRHNNGWRENIIARTTMSLHFSLISTAMVFLQWNSHRTTRPRPKNRLQYRIISRFDVWLTEADAKPLNLPLQTTGGSSIFCV